MDQQRRLMMSTSNEASDTFEELFNALINTGDWSRNDDPNAISSGSYDVDGVHHFEMILYRDDMQRSITLECSCLAVDDPEYLTRLIGILNTKINNVEFSVGIDKVVYLTASNVINLENNQDIDPEYIVSHVYDSTETMYELCRCYVSVIEFFIGTRCTEEHALLWVSEHVGHA